MNSLLAFMSCVLVSGCVSPALLFPPGNQTKASKPAPHSQELLRDAPQRIHLLDRDYGESIEQWRAWAVEHSLKSPLFWSLLAAIGVLGLAMLTIVHQRNQRERQEVIAAEFLAQYHNAWVHASRRAREAIARHNALVEKTSRASEAAELIGVNVSAVKTESEREPAASPSTVFLKGSLRPRSEVPSANEPRPSDKQRNLRQLEPDLLAQLKTLQQQLDAACEREKSLEKELKRALRPVTTEPKSNA